MVYCRFLWYQPACGSGFIPPVYIDKLQSAVHGWVIFLIILVFLLSVRCHHHNLFSPSMRKHYFLVMCEKNLERARLYI